MKLSGLWHLFLLGNNIYLYLFFIEKIWGCWWLYPKLSNLTFLMTIYRTLFYSDQACKFSFSREINNLFHFIQKYLCQRKTLLGHPFQIVTTFFITDTVIFSSVFYNIVWPKPTFFFLLWKSRRFLSLNRKIFVWNNFREWQFLIFFAWTYFCERRIHFELISQFK